MAQMSFSEDDEESDVEPEDTGERITDPFDPNKIRVRLWTPTVDLLLKRIKAQEIHLAGDFQRHAGIWTPKVQSRLIESLLIRIPLPAFYMDGANEDCHIVIDGIQRLTALKRFVIDGDLILSELEFLKDLERKSFQELPRALQRRIEETMVTVYVVEKGTPDDAMLNIFKRLNTGGTPLNAQEIRHAMNPGPVRDFLREMAESIEFMDATANGIKSKRMHDRECVARFMAFVLNPPSSYATGDLDAWIHNAMKALNSKTDAERQQLGDRFLRSMKAASNLFEKNAFRKVQTLPGGRHPINKALFEAWSVNLNGLSDDQLSTLIDKKEDVKKAFAELIEDERFMASISGGTGDVNKVKTRFARIEELLQDVLCDDSKA